MRRGFLWGQPLKNRDLIGLIGTPISPEVNSGLPSRPAAGLQHRDLRTQGIFTSFRLRSGIGTSLGLPP